MREILLTGAGLMLLLMLSLLGVKFWPGQGGHVLALTCATAIAGGLIFRLMNLRRQSATIKLLFSLGFVAIYFLILLSWADMASR